MPEVSDTQGEPAWQMHGVGGQNDRYDKFVSLAEGNTGSWAFRFRAHLLSRSSQELIAIFVKQVEGQPPKR